MIKTNRGNPRNVLITVTAQRELNTRFVLCSNKNSNTCFIVGSVHKDTLFCVIHEGVRNACRRPGPREIDFEQCSIGVKLNTKF